MFRGNQFNGRFEMAGREMVQTWDEKMIYIMKRGELERWVEGGEGSGIKLQYVVSDCECAAL